MTFPDPLAVVLSRLACEPGRCASVRTMALHTTIGPVGSANVPTGLSCSCGFAALRETVRQAYAAVDVLAEVREAFDSIRKNDTTQYNHHEPRKFDGMTPREAGLAGTRWAEPAEIAAAALRRMDAALAANATRETVRQQMGQPTLTEEQWDDVRFAVTESEELHRALIGPTHAAYVERATAIATAIQEARRDR